VHVTPLKGTLASHYSNAIVAVSKGMQAVKVCSNKMLQFLTGVPANQVVLYNGCKMVIVVVVSCSKCLVIKMRITSGYALMVHGRGCNPHRCTTTSANLEITSL